MGGPPGPAPKSMQASQSLLLSYLQRFNEKRRIHYKVDLQPRQPRETPTPRLQAPRKFSDRRSSDRCIFVRFSEVIGFSLGAPYPWRRRLKTMAKR